MGPLLHKVGAGAFKHKWAVIIGWVVVLIITAVLAKTFMLPTSSAITIPGLESAKALDKVSDTFKSSGQSSGQIVFAAPQGKKISDYEAQINTLVTSVGKVSGVVSIVSPFTAQAGAVSKDGTIAYASVSLKAAQGSVEQKTFDGVDVAISKARTGGLEVESGGGLINELPSEILGPGEVGGVVIALIVLLITLGSLISAGLPLLTALIAIGIGATGLYAFSHLITINSTTPVLAVMLGLAVGIDYSLFIISKFKSYLLEGHGYQEAAAKSIGTAGNAVIFAAGTVVIALAALAVVKIPFMTTMGLAGAATVALTGIVSVTLIPAFLGLAGTKIFGKKTRAKIAAAQAQGIHDTTEANHQQFWYKWGAFITRHPIKLLVAAVVIIAVIAIPVRSLTLGLPTDEFAAKDTTQRKAYDLLAKGFGAGFTSPLLVTVDNLPKVTDADKAAVRAPIEAQFEQQSAAASAQMQQQFTAQLAATKTPAQKAAVQQEVAAAQANAAQQQAAAQAQIEQQVAQYAPYYQLSKVATNISKVTSVQKAQAAMVTSDGTFGVIEVIPSVAPSDTKTQTLINYLRDSSNQKHLADTASIEVTGTAVVQDDVNAKLGAALPEYLVVVVGLSLLLLLLAFRSIIVPIKATLGFLLSLLAMFGGLVAVFQWGWFGLATAPGPIISFIPIISIGVLFGLAMDYEFFLVSSIHEAYTRERDVSKRDAKVAVINGFGIGSKVVTAAAIIMTSVFAGFITNGDTIIQAIGFGLGLGIFIDAFLVRMTIIPAALTLLGRAAWWLPGWLRKSLPNVSIEGEDRVERLK